MILRWRQNQDLSGGGSQKSRLRACGMLPLRTEFASVPLCEAVLSCARPVRSHFGGKEEQRIRHGRSGLSCGGLDIPKLLRIGN